MLDLPRRTVAAALVALPLVLAACADNMDGPTAPSVPFASSASAGVDLAGTQESPGVTPDDWIVVFRQDVQNAPQVARQLVAQHGGQIRFTYEHTIRGFAARLPAQALEGIRNNPNVSYVEQDGVVTANWAVGSWGLDRIDQRSLPLDQSFTPPGDGTGVRAYIMDTGIRFDHVEYAGRVQAGYDAFGGTSEDCHGHGTHVAGTVGGTTYGVAKNVTLVAVRVLDCRGSGSYSGIIAGMDWVTRDHQDRKVPAVANMSLGGSRSTSVNDALNRSVAGGVVYAVAAGNDNFDACLTSPASASDALTVGATTSTDARSSFSNYGTCLDLFAPGSSITSSTMTTTTSTGTWSGTSMATPHVTGVAALYLEANQAASPYQVMDAVVGGATQNVLSNVGTGSPNVLLYSGLAAPPPGPAAPTGLGATAVSSSQVELAWTDNSDEDGFRVQRSTDGVTFHLAATTGADVVSFSDTGLSAGTTYWYRVQAFYSGGGASAYSNVASATTSSLQVAVDGVPTVTMETGKFNVGTATVTVAPSVSGVTVTGDWYASGGTSPFRVGATGVTDASGVAIVDSGRRKDTPVMYFCVTGLSGSGIEDATTYPKCSGGFVPGDPGDPGDPQDPLAPTNLGAQWSALGGGRVTLTWTVGSGGTLDVYWGPTEAQLAVIATTADNGKYSHRGGSIGDAYKVCVQGRPDLCSQVAVAN